MSGRKCYLHTLAEARNVRCVVGMTSEEAVASYFKEREPDSLLQRFIQPSEVAAPVLFLATEGAAAINGAAVRVEGGVIRHTGG